MANTPPRLPTLPPESAHVTPGGTRRPAPPAVEPPPPPRPRQDTATDYAEARAQLAETGEPPRPELVEAKTAVNRLGRLEERADRTDREMFELKQEMRANTRVSSKGASASQVAAYAAAAGTLFVAISKALGEYGAEHPGAPLTLTGLALIAVRAFAYFASLSARAEAESRAGDSGHGGPPSASS